jgi:membrane protease YdiL (CAAX protease family)
MSDLPESRFEEPGSDGRPLPGNPVEPGVPIFLAAWPDTAPADACDQSIANSESRIGPGIFESLLWMFGFYVVQFMAVVFASVLLVLSFLTSTGAGPTPDSDPMGLIQTLTTFFGPHLIHLLGFSQLSTILYSLIALRLRLGKKGLHELGWQLPWKGHAFLIFALCIPLSFLCTAFQARLFEAFPTSRNEMAEMMNLLGQSPLWLLVLVIGLGPALGEELLFRGLIGRGLSYRYGLRAGLVVTSMLFGFMHLIPSQAIAVIPLGLAMHFVYLVTRSFWAPIALHLLNNSLAMVVLKFSSLRLIGKISAAAEVNQGGPVLVASAATVAAILILLWQTRVQYVLPDGSVWDPSFRIGAAPPLELEAVPLRQQPAPLMLAGSAFNSLGFAAGLWRLTDWAGLPW